MIILPKPTLAILPNNVALQWMNTGGAPQDVIKLNASNEIEFGAPIAGLAIDDLILPSTGRAAWVPGADITVAPDTILRRAAIGHVELHSPPGALQTTFTVFGDDVDASNYSKISILGNLGGSSVGIGVFAGGAYAGKHLMLTAKTAYGGSGLIVTDQSTIIPGDNNLTDLGRTGNQWRTGYFGTSLALASGANINWNSDVFLLRRAANTLAQQRGTTPQTFEVYGQYLDAGNYRRLSLVGDSGFPGPMIEASAAGSYSSTHLWLSAKAATGGSGFIVVYDSHIIPSTDNGFDLGRYSPAGRWRNGFFGGSLYIGNLVTNGNIEISAVHPTYFINCGYSPLQFRMGGTTRWSIHDDGVLSAWLPATDNFSDIGTITLKIRTGYFGTSVVNTGYSEFRETTDPAAGVANTARLYCKDNGAGKTQLCVRFNTGAVQVIATEP